MRARGKMLPGVVPVPARIDREVGRLKLEALGVEIDEPTAEQKDIVSGELSTCGTVKIVKDAVPNDPQSFAFTAQDNLLPSPGTFSLVDNGGAINTKEIPDVKAGTYHVARLGTHQSTISFKDISNVTIRFDPSAVLELDNLDGTSPLKHTVTISQEWAQTVQLDNEKSKVEGGTTSADLPGVGTFGRKAEAAVKSTYSITEGTKKTLTREFSFEVPPGTKRVVAFNYAQVWQHGVARLQGANGAVAEIPFRVAVDMTVNVAQHDTTA